jgi:hypothetical protein
VAILGSGGRCRDIDREEEMPSRQARLRPEYGEWYPKVTPDTWHNAAWLTEVVLQQQRRGTPTWALEGRPLSNEHFEFQGTGPPQGSRLRPRRNV